MATAEEKQAREDAKAAARQASVVGQQRLQTEVASTKAFQARRLRAAGDLSRYTIGGFLDDPNAVTPGGGGATGVGRVPRQRPATQAPTGGSSGTGAGGSGSGTAPAPRRASPAPIVVGSKKTFPGRGAAAKPSTLAPSYKPPFVTNAGTTGAAKAAPGRGAASSVSPSASYKAAPGRGAAAEAGTTVRTTRAKATASSTTTTAKKKAGGTVRSSGTSGSSSRGGAKKAGGTRKATTSKRTTKSSGGKKRR